MNFACFVSFMTFQFLKLGLSCQNLSYQDPNCDILHFFSKNSKMCASQPAQTEHFQNKASQPTFS